MSFISAFNPFFAFMWKTVKVVGAIFAYILAVYCTMVAEFFCIGMSYVLPHVDAVWMWAGFLLFMTGLWAGTATAIFALTLEKKRDDAHLTLWPMSFIAVVTVAVMALFAAAAGMWSKSGYDALGFAVMFTGIAGVTLHYLFTEAVKVWQSKRTRFA